MGIDYRKEPKNLPEKMLHIIGYILLELLLEFLAIQEWLRKKCRRSHD